MLQMRPVLQVAAMIASAGSRSGATAENAFESLAASLNRIAGIQENMMQQHAIDQEHQKKMEDTRFEVKE